MVATCVDTDVSKLWIMKVLYPDDWQFFVMDAWEFADEARRHGRTWDVVSVDTYLGDAEERSVTTLELWCSLAVELVTVTVRVGREVDVSDGWRESRFPRSSKAEWLVLRRNVE